MKLEQAARQALEALVLNHYYNKTKQLEAITALRKALAEQEPISKALRMAKEAMVYHTEQTRPIQKTDEAIVYLRNMMAQGASSMTFTLEDAMAKYPEISYWHSEFLKHNTTAEQAEQEPVAFVSDVYQSRYTLEWNGRSLPIGTQLYDHSNSQPAVQAKHEPVACEPVLPIDDDGWSDWICPKPQGYLMQCCDCGLIHEVDSRVAKYKPRPSEEFEVVDDQNMQSQWRMRRRDDLASTQQAERMIFQAREIGESEWFDVGLDETERINAYINSPHIDYRRLYTAPVRTKDLTDDEIFAFDNKADIEPLAFARAVIAKDREKNNV